MTGGTHSETTRRLRILIVTQYFWPENFQINHIAKALQARGHHVSVLTGKPNYPGGRFFPGYSWFNRGTDDFDGIKITRAPLIPRGDGGSLRLALNYLSFAASGVVTAIARIKGPVDCIFVYEPSPVTVGLPALALKRKLGAPILFWVQDLWPDSVYAAGDVRSNLLRAVLDRLVRRIYGGCARILIQSEAFRPAIEAAGVDQSRIVYWPQSVDPMFRPAPPSVDGPAELELPGFRIVFGGNVGHAQDFETVVEAADRLREHDRIRWIVIGDGRRYAWLRSEIERRGLGDRFHLLGRFPEEAMPSLFAQADALLVTLRKHPIFALTIPTKVQAYLACGKPILGAIDGEGARIIAESGAGIAAPAGDAAALADAALRLARLPEAERAQLGAKGLAYSREHFDRDRLVDRLIQLMHGATAPGRDASGGAPSRTPAG
jgi:glycosyltransferase involved in cell wall biosynthesis